MNTDRPDDGYMTSEQVCEFLQVKMDWLYSHVAAGNIPYIKIGRMLRFKRSELELWIEEHRQ